MSDLSKELVKLLLQFAGALLIARLTVSWALTRFKSEKTWEKQLTAFADVLSALRDLRRVLEKWMQQEIGRTEFTESYSEQLRNRWQSSKKRFEEVSAIAILILDEALEADLQNVRSDSPLDHLETRDALITTALHDLLAKKERYRTRS